MNKIKVLLVDDHKLIRNGLKSLIKTAKEIAVVGECNNGREAIDFIEKNPTEVDVVLMDINMPELNGIDTTEIIAKIYPDINILALTMHTEEAYITEMIKAGALGYILKDSSKKELIEAINTVFKKKKYYSKDVSYKLINMLLNDDKKEKSNLSEREIQILKQITHGSTNKEIGIELHISNRTVETHRRNIIKKLEVKNTAELVSYALSNGLV